MAHVSYIAAWDFLSEGGFMGPLSDTDHRRYLHHVHPKGLYGPYGPMARWWGYLPRHVGGSAAYQLGMGTHWFMRILMNIPGKSNFWISETSETCLLTTRVAALAVGCQSVCFAIGESKQVQEILRIQLFKAWPHIISVSRNPYERLWNEDSQVTMALITKVF